jgi:hypothetical protein
MIATPAARPIAQSQPHHSHVPVAGVSRVFPGGAFTLIALCLALLWPSMPVAAASPSLAERIDQAAGAHPRLIFKAKQREAIQARIEAQPLLGRAYDRLVKQAEAIFKTAPIERKKTGRRMLSVSRRGLRRVSQLAFLHRLTGEKRYAKRAEREMLAAAGFQDWNPSHFLDVAEMTAALAIGYDWLYDALSPKARKTIRTAIVENGLKTSLDGGWWVTAENNWNQVCHGGLVLGALAVMDHEPKLAKRIIERALDNIGRSMSHYGPRGGYPEGPGYWAYGTSYNVLMIDALQSALGSDFNLTENTGFTRSAGYYLHAQGPTGRYFNYSDCGERAGFTPAAFWFAQQLQKPSLLWMERQKLEGKLNRNADFGYMLPLLFVWASDVSNIHAPDGRHRRIAGTTPVGLHRSAWHERASYLGLKGGTPAANHGHMDIGSFVMAADGVRWAVDLGSQSYHSLESIGINLWHMSQSSERWQVFRLNNHSHNTLVVNGKKQRVEGQAPIVDFSKGQQGGAPAFSIVDMRSVYAGQLAQAKRGVALLSNGAVVIQDHLRAPADRPATVRWAMVTRAEVRLDGQRATLSQDGQTLTLQLQAPGAGRLETFKTNPPPAEYDAENPGTRMVGFKVRLKPGQSKRLRVQLVPGSAAGAQAKQPPAKLRDW